jgi:hypothetical protein
LRDQSAGRVDARGNIGITLAHKKSLARRVFNGDERGVTFVSRR